MALSVQTNNAAMTALKHLNSNNNAMNKSLEHLSSGFRVNNAADDASGYAVSSKLDAQSERLKTASLNATQAQAMTKMADAGVNEIQNMVIRIQTLAVQASSANNAGELGKLDAERLKLESAIDKIAGSTNYNGVNLLNGQDAAGANTTSDPFSVVSTSIANAVVSNFQATAQDATYTFSSDGAGNISVTSSSGATGTGTYVATGAAAIGTAPTTSNPYVAGASAPANAAITGAVVTAFGAAAPNDTYDVQIDQYGTVQVLNGAGTVVGTGGLNNVTGGAVATAATGGGYVAGTNTGITGVAFASSTALTNEAFTIDLAPDGLTFSVHDAAGNALTATNAAGTAAGATATTFGTGGTNTLTITDAQGGTTTLTVTVGAAADTTNIGAGTGGTFTLTGAVAATAGSEAIALTDGSTLTVSYGDTSTLTALTAGYVSAGTVTTSGGTTTPGAAGTGTITMSDGTSIAVTYGAADVAGAAGSVTTSGRAAYATALSFQVGADNDVNNQVGVDLSNSYTTASLGLGGGDLLSQANAKAYIDLAKSALDQLVTQRADLGATQNQVAFIQANLATSIEQATASVSAIRDADMASEMAQFTKNQILTQASTSMLAQANQAAQNVMTLFR